MNEYGALYMSTVGCGIVYGSISDGTTPDTTKPTDTTEPTDNTKMYGDVNLDGEVTIVDVLLLNQNLLAGSTIKEQGVLNADVDVDGKPTSADAMAILKYTIGLITELPLKAE